MNNREEEPCGCRFNIPERVMAQLAQELYCVEKIACVPLDKIAIKEVWAPERLEDIRKWADEETLNSANVELEVDKRFEGVDSYRLPRLARVDGEKYRISDGIHRVARAKEMGLCCILAFVEDCHTPERTEKPATS